MINSSKYYLLTTWALGMLLFPSILLSQLNTDSFHDGKGWSVGVDLLPVVKSSSIYPRYSVLIIKNGAPWRLRSRIGFEFDRESSETEDFTNELGPSKFEDQSIRAYASLGVERTLFREKRLSAICGAAAFVNYFTNDRDSEIEAFSFDETTIETYNTSLYTRNLDLGILANLDFQYNIADHLSLRVENTANFTYKNEQFLGEIYERSIDFGDSIQKSILTKMMFFSSLNLIYSL